MLQYKTLDRLTLQNLINAYCFETGHGTILAVEQQDATQQQVSQNKPLLVLTLAPLNTIMVVPVDRVSQLGQHRFAETPFIFNNHQSTDSPWVTPSSISLASLIIEDIVHHYKDKATLDANGVLKRWIESYEGLQIILEHRSDEIDDIVEYQQNFIETEQNLIYGHAMHPTPKAVLVFMTLNGPNTRPKPKVKTQLHYWLVHPSCLIEEFVDGDSIAAELMAKLLPDMSAYQQQLIAQNPEYKLLPLHPWQATFAAATVVSEATRAEPTA